MRIMSQQYSGQRGAEVPLGGGGRAGGAPARSQRQPSRPGARPAAGLQRTTMWVPLAGVGAGAGADTATPARWLCLWSLLAAALGLLTAGVSALEVITPKEMYFEYGTLGKLPCKFKSGIVTSSRTTVSWSILPAESLNNVTFFHFSNGKVTRGDYEPLRARVIWAGDLLKQDASIQIRNMQYNDNATYICDVQNPPDDDSQPGHIRLYVVEKIVPSPVLPQTNAPEQRKHTTKAPPASQVLKRVAGVGAALFLSLIVVVIVLGDLYINTHP